MKIKLVIVLVFVFVNYRAFSQITTATNGLNNTANANTVVLGGTLTGNTSIDLGSTFTFNLKKSAANYFHMLNNGNIGIGLNNPVNRLHIYKNTAGNTDPLLLLEDGNTSGYAMQAFKGTQRTYHIGVGNHNATTFGLANKFFIWDQNATAARLVVDASGNTGIGTSAPQYRLDVNGITRVSGNLIAAGGNIDLNSSGPYSNLQFNTANGLAGVITGASSNDLFIRGVVGLRLGSNNENDRLVIAANGNVGIGNSNPSYKLDVNGQGNFTDKLYVGDITTFSGVHSDIKFGVMGNILAEGLRIGYGAPQNVTMAVNGPYRIGSFNYESELQGYTKLQQVYNQAGEFLTRSADGFINSRTAAQVIADLGLSGGSGGSPNWTSNGNNIYNSNSGNVLIGSTTDNGQKFQVNGNTTIVGSTSISGDGSYLSIQQNHVGANPLINLSSADGGGVIIGGSSGVGFVPTISLKPDGAIYNTGYLLSETQDAGSYPAVIIDGRKSNGPLVNQDLFGVSSYNNFKLKVTAGGNLVVGSSADNGNKLQVQGNASVNGNLGVVGSTYISGDNSYLQLHRQNIGVNTIVDIVNGGGGSLKLGGGSSNGFTPTITLKPDGTVYNQGCILAETQDAGTYPALTLDSRKLGGPLTTQDLFGIASYNNIKMKVTAGGNLVVGSSADNGNKLQVQGTAHITDNVGIGTAPFQDYKLAVNGNAIFNKVKVKVYPWADYVFEPTYKLPTLQEVEAYIKKHKHLPDVPSAKEVEANGLDVGDNQAVLLKKIEELTLYMIEINKKVEKLSEENVDLKNKLKTTKK